jgi:hypothetical protein
MASAMARRRVPCPGILGEIDAGRQAATVDRTHGCTPATSGTQGRVNPDETALARVAANAPTGVHEDAASRRMNGRPFPACG